MDISATLSRAAISAVTNTSPKIGVFMNFFPVIETLGERIIELDFKKNGANVASYVNPSHKSKPGNIKGFNVKAFILPTKKDKFIITSEDLSKKLLGTTIYAQVSTQQKALALMNTAVMDLRTKSANKDEISAIDQVFNGTLAVVGEGENRSLDFERSASHTVDLGAGNYWDEVAGDPSADFDTFIEIAGESGHTLTDCIGRPTTMRALTSNATVKDELDNRRVENGDLKFQSMAATAGVIYYGIYKEIRLWGYSGNYVDIDGTAQKAVPAKKVAFLSELSQNGTVEGYTQDVKVALNDPSVTIDESNFIVKTELSDEPSDLTVHGIQTSAPLLLDPDSTLSVTVLV